VRADRHQQLASEAAKAVLIRLVSIVAIIELLIAAVDAKADRHLDGMRRR
jgi:hypothetical protein